ncbi:hypothetical protein ALC57_14834 [Trachymyrmex cornetzi]|uniref:Uncharacterized protein n=1 Tax=Trachymyrmex cornetzi TaxID=471704 RepID=A0A151IXM6_9HYME|nr:hypothetical protein ALC57_14834 [Trachymyrmex cornetzi]
MDHEEKYGNPCYANVRRIFIKKCAIGVMINTLLASSYCPSSIVTDLKYYVSKHTMIPVLRREKLHLLKIGTIEFLSPTCGPDEYCPVLMIGSSRQKNAPHLVLSKSIFSRIHRIPGVVCVLCLQN